MSEIFDAGCFCGHWPYRKLRTQTFHDLSILHKRLGISGGLVSNLSSVFYHDPSEGDAELAHEIAGTSYLLACNINPALQGCNICTERTITSLSPRALRLYPTIHKFPMDLPVLDAIAGSAAETNIPIFLTARMEDPRLDFLLEQTAPDIDAFLSYSRKNPHTKFVLSGFYSYELCGLSAPLPENVWVDLAGCFKPFCALSSVFEQIPKERILYASFSSLKSPHATLLSVYECGLSPDLMRQILSENYLQLFTP